MKRFLFENGVTVVVNEVDGETSVDIRAYAEDVNITSAVLGWCEDCNELRFEELERYLGLAREFDTRWVWNW